MSIPDDMWDSILIALSTSASANLSSASAGDDLYEGYVWSLILEAAQNERATIRLLDRNGNLATSFWFRTQPSGLASHAHNYCHAEIAFQRCPTLEAHIGVYVTGKSKVKHECDVAVVFKDEADTCRLEDVDPRASKVMLTVECKYYINSNAGINHGRSFLGLINDIYGNDRYFVATQASPSVSRLFARHNKEYEVGMSPLRPDLEVRLRGAFEKTFRDFKSGYS